MSDIGYKVGDVVEREASDEPVRRIIGTMRATVVAVHGDELVYEEKIGNHTAQHRCSMDYFRRTWDS